MSTDRPMSSPRMSQAKRRSHLSSAGSISNGPPVAQSAMLSQRPPQPMSRRSSQSSLRSIRTVATTYSVNSTATSASICSAKFERAYANQAQIWTSTNPSHSRRPSLSSQFSVNSIRNVPPHVVAKRANLQKQLKVVEGLLRDTPNLVLTETGSVGWLLAHERHLLQVAIKYDERATSEWEAAQDWQVSAQEGPVSKIFVTQPSRFGLTPEQHRYRVGQAMTLGNNALDLWRFSDLNYQDAYKIRGAREKLQTEQSKKMEESSPVVEATEAASDTMSKRKSTKKDFQTWFKEVSKNGSLKSVVKDDGTLDKLEQLSIAETRPSAASNACVIDTDSLEHKGLSLKSAV